MSKNYFIADVLSAANYHAALGLELNAETAEFQKELVDDAIHSLNRLATHQQTLLNILSEIKFKFNLSPENQTTFEEHCETKGVPSDVLESALGFNEYRPQFAQLFAQDDNGSYTYKEIGDFTLFETAICVALCVTSPFWDSINFDFYI